ncbi:MAG: DUF423 domain-containing protein [Cellvibrionales bacterium]|nr:DUF423 domain-containing protein [Cellvibrionales bacterium]
MWIVIGAITALMAVAMGAATSHGLQAKLTANAFAQVQIAIDYQFYHALALVVLGGLLKSQLLRPRAGLLCGMLFVLGLLLFSGGIYVKHLVSSSLMTQFIPLGGMSFMAGWLMLVLATVGYERKSTQ